MTFTAGERVRLKVGYAPLGPDVGTLGTVRAATPRPAMYHGPGPWYAIDWDGTEPGHAGESHLERVIT